jgi:hypothetical protein
MEADDGLAFADGTEYFMFVINACDFFQLYAMEDRHEPAKI